MRKRVLAVVLMITMLFGNTMSVSAAPSVSGNVVDVVTEEEGTLVETGESLSSEEESVEEESLTEEKGSFEEESSIVEDGSEEESSEETSSIPETTEEETTEEATTEEETTEEETVDELLTAAVSKNTTEKGPIYAGYFGLPSVLTPTVAPTSGYWEGDIIYGLGSVTGTNTSDLKLSNYCRTDVWKILDPDWDTNTALLWGAGAHVTTDFSSEEAITTKYLSTGESAWFTDIERAAIKNVRLLTESEATNTEYGYHFDETISGYMSTNIGSTPAIELNTEQVFMTLYSDYTSTPYKKFDVTQYENEVRKWNVIFKSDDTGFNATLPDTIPYNGYFTVDVTALGSLDYDKISMVIADESGQLLAHNSDIYDSEVTTGEFEFSTPSEIQPGKYTLYVFEEKEYQYVSNVVTKEIQVIGQSITNLSLDKQYYGQTRLAWEIENKRTEDPGTYTWVDIYRAESIDGVVGNYELVEESYGCSNTASSYTWWDSNVLLDENGSNRIYYYKVVMNGGSIDGCEAVSNKGVPYRSLSGDIEDYKRIYIAEKNNEEYVEVTGITMRPQEYRELYLVMEKEDGSIVVDEIVSTDQNGYSSDSITWCLYSAPATGSYISTEEDEEAENSGLKMIPINPDVEWTIGFAECSEEFVADKTYYIFVQRNISGIGRYWVQIPVKTAEAGDDAYTKLGECDLGVHLTAESLNQAMREDMVARKASGTYYVSQEGYYEWGGIDDVYDFAAEREGMLPEEGDYLKWQCFDPEKVVDHREGWLTQTPVYLQGQEWWKIELEQVYYTTAEQEAEVTQKIDYILTNENGGLNDLWKQYYRADGNYTTAERKAIADACCQYVYDNVNYIGTVTPKYHSAWSAIVNKTGTCQAYALYLTRLLREFGIRTKILTGTDANYHTYNIVQIDADKDEWYYYDATGGIKYKTESEFGRTKYQDMFVNNSMFIQNYISKIVGTPYEAGIYLYGDGELIGKYFEMIYAVWAMYDDVEIEGRENTRYTIKLMQDSIMSGYSPLSVAPEVSYCEVDLNGYQLTLANGGYFNVDCLKNGTLYQPLEAYPNETVFGCSNGSNKTAVYEDLTLNVQYCYGNFTVQADPDEDPEDARVICRNVKTSELSNFYATGNVYMDEDCSVNAVVSTELYGVGKEHDLALLGTINTEELFAYGNIDIGTLIVSERAYEVGSDSKIYNYWNKDYASATMNIYDEFNVKGHLGIFTADKSAEDSTKQDMQFNLVQLVDENNKVQKTGKFIVGSEGLNVNWDYAGVSGSVVFGKKIMRIADDAEDVVLEDLGYTKFDSGETIATIKASATDVPTSGFKLYNQAEKETIIRNGNTLIAARETVNVAHTDSVTGTELITKYTSLESAIASMATDFGSDKGTYTFTFVESAKMNANVTMPAFAQNAVFCAQTQDTEGNPVDITLDFNGYGISSAAVVEVEDSLKCINTSDSVSKWNMTGANGSDGYVIKLTGEFSGVDVSATKGTIVLETENEEFVDVDSTLSAGTVFVQSGKWNVGIVSATTFTNQAVAQVEEVKNITTLNNKAQAVLIVDTYTQKTTGITNLESGSKLLVKSNAKIYNTVIGGTTGTGTEPVYVYRMSDYTDKNGAEETANCSVAFEGKVTSTNEALQIAFGVLDPEADAESIIDGDGNLSELRPRTKLFTTSIKNFPVELFTVNQNTESPAYKDVYQQDTNIYVGREWIAVYAKQVNGDETELKRFIRWTDAAAYLETLANTQMEYVVEISEDVELFTDLTLPKKVKGITFRGSDTDETDSDSRITLTYTGDIKLASNTTFENIDLVATKYDSKSKTYTDYQSAVTLNGMTLTMANASARFTSITGNNKSKVVLGSAQVEVTKAVTSLGYLDMRVMENVEREELPYDTILTADNITVTDTLTMQSAKIDCVNKIALKNVVTKDDNNVLSYGGNTSKDGLTISGSVTADTAEGMTDETIIIRRTEVTSEGTRNINEQAKVRKNAIELQVKSMESAGYANGALICTAEKAGAGWFVVGFDGTEEEVRVFTHGTYKVKNKEIHCGEIIENVKLYSSNSGEAGTYSFESGFETLQDALTEIDKLAVNDAYYRIELVNAEENVATFSSKTPTFPSKTKGITIAGDSELASPYFYFKGNLSFKSDTTFEDMVFVPETKSSISLGNFELHLKNCAVDISRSGVEFSGITGSGVNGTSALILEDTVLAVAGNVNNVGKLLFAGEAAAEPDSSVATFALLRSTPAYPRLTVDGSVNVGSVVLEKEGYITGLATVARSNGVVTKVTPQITINKDVTSNDGHTLYLDLREKVSNGFEKLNFDEMTDILKSGIPLAKALYTTYPNIKAEQRNEEPALVKSGSYLTYFEDGYGVVLSYEGNVTAADGTINWQTVQIPCRTFADAVTEINNQKTKRDYTIILQPAITEISGADQGGAVPKALAMPNKNYVDTLTIQAPENNDAVKLGFINNITLTSPVVLENVQFVQMMKVGSEYQTSDFAKENFPGALTFNTAGFAVTIKGENTFNTPLVMNGSNKTVLTFDENGTITTLTNGYEVQNSSVVENVIYGSLSNMDTVNVNDCNLTLHAYKTSPTATSYTESKNKITTVNVTGTEAENNGTTGNITVESPLSKGEFVVTNYNSKDGKLFVEGKVNLKNVSLEGDAVAAIHADTNFDITGNLISRSNYALLETRLKGAGKEPYLNISGNVVRVGDTTAIEVAVYPEIGAADTNSYVDLKNVSGGKAQLLTAKSAQSADFKLSNGNYSGGEYSAEDPVNTNGYMLLKEGGKIYVYNGEKVNLAVYKGEYAGADTSELLGYYPSFKEAAADVDALKDKTQAYTFVLTKTNGTLATPVSVTLPTQAESVTVTRLANSNNNEKVYFSGNISLKCDTTFEQIEFAPVSNKAGTAFSISTGAYDVTLRDVSVSTESDKMALKDISGNGKGNVTLDSPNLEMTGAITNAAELIVSEDALIKANVKAATLSLCNSDGVGNAGITLSVNGTVTVDTLENNGTVQNTLEYSRNAGNKNSNLTINKEIVNETEGNQVVLKQQDAYSLTALTKVDGKVTFANAAKALTLPKASTDSFVLEAECVAANGQTLSVNSNTEGYTVVKADKGVYVADSTLKNDIVQLKRTVYGTEDEIATESVTNCLDYSQAVNEINTLADAQYMQYSYEIQFLASGSDAKGGSPIDTNVKDAAPYGTFTLPKSNAKKELVVKGVENGTTIIPFTGNISGQGMVTMQNLVLNPVKSGTDSTPADTKISITADKTATKLTLENVSTNEQSAVDAKSTGFIASIGGTKNKTNVSLVDCEGLIVKSGISNIAAISLDNTKLLSDGAVTVDQVELLHNSTWDSLGKMTITDVYVEIPEAGTSTSYIGTKQDNSGNSQFVVNGDVFGILGNEESEEIVNNATLLCKVYATDATIADADEIFALADSVKYVKEPAQYAGVSLVSAKKAGADKFRAYAFRAVSQDGSIADNSENITKDNLVAYKDGVYVKNGNMDNMQVKLLEFNQDGTILSTSYAATFEDAVTTINNKADMTAYYEIEFIQAGTEEEPEVVIQTTKKGTAYGALTLPSKAAGVTISGYVDENQIPCTVIKYTGTLKASCNVTFENILLTEGKADTKQPDGFAEDGMITPAPANNVTITFNENVYTYQNSVAESIQAENDLVIGAVNAGKGHLVFNGHTVFTEKTLSIGSLTLLDGASFDAVGKVTIADLIADANETNSLSSEEVISIGNIKNQNEEDGAQTANVRIQSDFTKITKEGAFGNSQLTISGLVEDVNVKLNFRKYVLPSKTYVDMEQSDYEKLLMQTDGKPDAYKKLAAVPKASLDWITIAEKDANVIYGAFDHNDSGSQNYLYKYEAGLYLTNLQPLVLVNGYNAPEDSGNAYVNEKLCYQAEFLSWDQAVKEIEKINDKTRYYEMRLLDTIGYNSENQKIDSPIGTITMPSKAAEVFITSAAGEENGIFFTGTNVTLKCPTRMENVGFTCLKKQGSGVNISYQPVTYTMNIGNFELIQNDIVNEFCNEETVAYKVSGSAKGIFNLVSDTFGDRREFAEIKGMDKLIVNYTNALAEGDGYENFTVDCLGDVSVKNIEVTNSTVEAKNMTVSTLATLDEAALHAGTSAANDGKMTLKDIALEDNGNALRAEQNKSGATQLTINGTVTETADATEDALAEGTLEIALYYNNYEKGNNYQKPVQLYDGMILCAAQKAASSLFVPAYTEIAQNGDLIKNGMGRETNTHGIYKSGKNICYGRMKDDEMQDTKEVLLSIGDSGMTTYFTTFEEAVKEIDSLSLYKDPTAKTKEYEDYTITLLSDVEIGNDKKNNSYSALSLPSKAKELTIDGTLNEANGQTGYMISFNGNVSVKCNTKFSDTALYPIKNVKGQGVKTAVNYSIGNYTLELDNTVSEDEKGMSLIANVSGSSKSGILKLAAGAENQVNDISISQLTGLREVILEEYTQLHVVKNCTVYQLTFDNSATDETSNQEGQMQEVPAVEAEGLPVLSVDGALTMTLVNAENAGKADDVYGIVRKPIDSKMTVNGLYEDRDKDKEKEYYSLSFPESDTDGCIKVEVVGSPCPAGTLVLTGKYLHWEEIQDNMKVVSVNASSEETECYTYTQGTNLYIGEKAD